MSEYKKSLGQQGEQVAALEYAKRGYKILGRNVRVHGARQIGEIDIVASRGNELVFVEVKTRTTFRFGTGAESIDYYKKRKLIRAAKVFMLQRAVRGNFDWRFDVVQVDIDNNRTSVIILENVIDDLD